MKNNLKLIWHGLYIKEINTIFLKNQNIILDKTQLKIGKEISDERKNIIFEVYNMFGKLSDFKIRELILSNESPLNFIYKIPEVLYMYMCYSIGVPKNMTKQWFEDNFLQKD